jgi:hypothetical protein
MRTLEERGALLQNPEARSSNDKLLLDLLVLYPPPTVTAPGVSERERGVAGTRRVAAHRRRPGATG